MKTQIVYLTIVLDVLSLTTLQIYGQSRLPEYKDTSQTITRDELILEQTRLSKERQAKRQASKIIRQKNRDSLLQQRSNQATYNEKTQNARLQTKQTQKASNKADN